MRHVKCETGTILTIKLLLDLRMRHVSEVIG